jgi:superoxide reductase
VTGLRSIGKARTAGPPPIVKNPSAAASPIILFEQGVRSMATVRLQVYKCSVCGNQVEVIGAGDGTLVCCNKPIELFVENTTDAAQEKHVPVVQPVDGGVKVTVGSVPHPMLKEHWIEWIEVIAGGTTYRQFLSPGDPPEAVFPVENGALVVRAFCNLHGLWKAA